MQHNDHLKRFQNDYIPHINHKQNYFFRSLNFAGKCRHQFGKLVILGISVFLFLHFAINISMVLGLIPVVGAPLPFFSYGGTMMMIVLV